MDDVTQLLAVRHVTKSFFGTTVLDDVSVDFRPGEVHAIVGENGAGKSTLMKILGGEYRPDAGTVQLGHEILHLTHPRHALARGISVIHQEFTLLPERTVAENVLLGREPRRRFRVDRRAMATTTAALLDELNLGAVSPYTPVRRLSVAQQQGVEIAKALSHRPQIVIMDEPTAALASGEVAALFARIRDLAARGRTVLYISHRLAEVFELADRVTVLKDGRLVTTCAVGETTAAGLVGLMVGRPAAPAPARRTATPGPVRLSVRGARIPGLSGVDLDLRAGEIVGVAGLDGSGRSELARALSGAVRLSAGTVCVDGRRRRLSSPRGAIRAGIAFLTADRKAEGLVLPLAAADNGLLAVRALRLGPQPKLADLASRVGLRPAALGREVRLLSGGNQQKVVLAKWLATGAGIYVFDEPTRGIDVGAKATIHQLMRDLAAGGAAILMISSDLPEVIEVSDRILVMRHGAVAGELPAGAAEEEIMSLAVAA
jgi:ABC-type sugar transport system ATPase subunit